MLRSMQFLALFFLGSVMLGCGSKPGYKTMLPTDPNYIAAQELKLKVRELADQLIASLPNDSLADYIALPTSFVDQNDFSESSPLGRYMVEGLTYEFNQRGFPVREYRTDGVITMDEGTGETTLARKGKLATAKGKNNVLILGTYHLDQDAIFVNARMVRPSDQLVLRTAQIMLTPNPVTLRMANAGPDGRSLKALLASKKKPGQMVYPEPGYGPLYAYSPGVRSGGRKIRQAPKRAAPAVASAAAAPTPAPGPNPRGLMGYVPE
ncbi:MAG: hypothetical protein LBH94_00205 [Deltaproteobacteria bacterium]|jgi:hypothetical protein|nr:hypothetical protein [Deltaproteobacteria bacterium]